MMQAASERLTICAREDGTLTGGDDGRRQVSLFDLLDKETYRVLAPWALAAEMAPVSDGLR